jgi:hypothetical protein
MLQRQSDDEQNTEILATIYDRFQYDGGRLRLDDTLEIVLDHMDHPDGTDTYLLHWQAQDWDNDQVADLKREQYVSVLTDVLNSPDLPTFKVLVENKDEGQTDDLKTTRFRSFLFTPRVWDDTLYQAVIPDTPMHVDG